ncbi:MAG: hypothetical protein HUJ68_14370, partial [Clostridia bacterium]|nr:hypothetical protein [Clostridia bacterium]
MSDFTFLTKEQCFGDDKLGILEKRGTQAAITDFSILLGGSTYSDDSLAGRTGYYWIRTDDGYNNVCVVTGGGYWHGNYVNTRREGARPALPFSSIDKIPTNGESGKRARDGILEV